MPFFLGDIILYRTLCFLLFLTLLICGWGISKDNKQKNFWKFASIATFFYTFIEGLRWGRGVDYFHYQQDLTSALFADYDEPIYLLWIDFFKITGLPYWCGFLFYSFILIFGVVLILKIYPKLAIWVLPLFYIITVDFSENLIRQYFAIPFIMFALYFWLIKKKILMWTSLLICPLIHISGIYAVILFVIFTHINFKLKYWMPLCSVLCYFFLLFLFKPSYFGTITNFLSAMNLGTDIRLRGYLNDSERWFGIEGSISYIHLGRRIEQGIARKFFLFIIDSIIIGVGYYVLKNHSKLRIIYLYAVLAILMSAFGDVEMYQRFSQWTMFLLPFLIGFILNTRVFRYNVLNVGITVLLCLRFFFVDFIMKFANIPYTGCAFVWDV